MFYRENRAKIANFPHIHNISATNLSPPTAFIAPFSLMLQLSQHFSLAISHKVRNFAPQKRYCF